MKLLTDNLPENVIIHNQIHPINFDFRCGIQFEMIMESSDEEVDKINKALNLYYEHIPEDLTCAIEQMIWFYQCGETSKDNNDKSGEINKRVYSYEYDQNLIYTAFFQYYHIDLTSVSMHWWKFQQLFLDLPKEASIKQAMMFRGMQLTPDMSSEQRSYYAKMKYLYRLPDERTNEQKARSFASVLAGGMIIKYGKDEIYE